MPPTNPWEAFLQRPARRLSAGAFVYLSGDAAGSVYLLRSGLVITSAVWRDGRQLSLRLVRPGELFGLTSLGASEHGEHARALEGSEVVGVPATEFVGRVAHDPVSAAVLLKQLALHLAEAREVALSLAFAGSMERLCLVLQKLATELGEAKGSLTTIPHYIKQEDVARMTGARREIVSGFLNRLRELGAIRYSRKGRLQIDRSTFDRYLESVVRRGHG